MPADAAVRSVSVHASLSLQILSSSHDRGERGRALRSSASRPDGGALRLLLPPSAHTEAAERPSPCISYLRAASLFKSHRLARYRVVGTSEQDWGQGARHGGQRVASDNSAALVTPRPRCVFEASGKVFWHNMRPLA